MKARYDFVPQSPVQVELYSHARAVQRAHERAAEHRHPGRVLRARASRR